MCGIICILSSETNVNQRDNLIALIENRGPDYFGELALSLTPWDVYFAASILHTQGAILAQQPIILNTGDILLWNGDVFGGSLLAENCSSELSDSEILAKWLEMNDSDIIGLVSKLEGPYSFIYLDKNGNRLWFGRDPLGRHSLLYKISDEEMILSSVGHKDVTNLKEVPAIGIFYANIENSNISIHLYQWSHWNVELSAEELPSDIIINSTKINYFKNFESAVCNFTNDALFFKKANFSSNLDLMIDLLNDQNVENLVNELLRLLMKSCEKRIIIRRNFCKNCPNVHACSPEHVKLGILFSGGLDSTIVACIADKFVPKADAIDLLNVAFKRNGNFDVPDRKTGRKTLLELQTLCPDRVWNFVEINVTQEELFDIRQSRISHLIYPLNTVLDESLGCALWFVCRGQGYLNNVPYTSAAKILLLGSGADEQFGGYMRHKNLLCRNNWNELQKQLLKETLLISKRNLGRDDRVVCDCGRQPRFPFLDEAVVEFVAELPPWKKCDPVSFPRGVGDKLLLRLVAVKLGLVQCASFPKRAFQFGSRIANAKEKGDDFSERL